MRAGTGEQGVFEHVDSRAELLPEGGSPQEIHLNASYMLIMLDTPADSCTPLPIWDELMRERGQWIRYGCSGTARALNQAVDARTRWSAPRLGEQPRRYTQGDCPRRTNVWSLDTYRRWLASPQPGAPAPS